MLARFRSQNWRGKAIGLARAAYAKQLTADGLKILGAGTDQRWVEHGEGASRSWLLAYDPDPDLFPFLVVHAHLYTTGRGFARTGAYMNTALENVPEDRIHVLDLHVDPADRGRGLGTCFIQATIDLADEGGLAVYGELSVTDDVDRLSGFYRGFGFEVRLFPESSGVFVGEIRRPPQRDSAVVDDAPKRGES